MDEQIIKPAPSLSADERTWAMLAHLTILVNIPTGFLGLILALVIYIVYKDRSRYVSYQAMQAFLFQLVFWVGGGALTAVVWLITGVLSAILIGICCIPFALVVSIIPIAALIYGVIGAIACNSGEPFRYWLIADWIPVD